MPAIQTNTETVKIIDADGNITETTKETTKKIEQSKEPDYIKIYTRVWCEINEIPEKWRELFLQLAVRMTYARASDPDNAGGQIVSTGGPLGEEIRAALGWKTRVPYQKGLRALCECNAIKRVGRGFYQINPSYAGRGEWKYNPRLDRGGIENIVGTFDLKEKKVDATIIWADDGTDNELNETYRRGLGVKDTDGAVLSQKEIRAAVPADVTKEEDAS